jgi:hypothetical protein
VTYFMRLQDSISFTTIHGGGHPVLVAGLGRATGVAPGSSLAPELVLQRGPWEWKAQQGRTGSSHSLNASSQAAGEQLESSLRAAGEQLGSSRVRAAGEQLESSWNRAAGGQLESSGSREPEYVLSRKGRKFITLFDPLWYVLTFYEKTSYVWGITHRAWNKLCHALWGNTKLRVATFNANGLQTTGAWRQFLVELDQWVSVHRVSVVIIQEHNWHPDTERDRKAEAAERRATLTIGFAAEGGSGVHWGGVAILTYDDMTTIKSVVETASDLVSVEVVHGEHVVPIVGVYAPAQPAQRVSMFQTKPHTVPGGTGDCTRPRLVGWDWGLQSWPLVGTGLGLGTAVPCDRPGLGAAVPRKNCLVTWRSSRIDSYYAHIWSDMLELDEK